LSSDSEVKSVRK